MYSPLKTSSKSRPCLVCGRGDKSCSLGDDVIFCRAKCGILAPDGWHHVKWHGKTSADMYARDDGGLVTKAMLEENRRIQKEKREAKRNRSNSTSSSSAPSSTSSPSPSPSPSSPVTSSPTPASTPCNSFTRALEDSVPLTENKCKKLGKELSIPWQAFDRVLGMKYLVTRDYGMIDPAYITPEKDGSLNTIGVSVRSELDGSKISYGKRGLCIPVNWAEMAGSPGSDKRLYLVEGSSDTAAGVVMGMNVIGRPSNMGGADIAIEFIRKNYDHTWEIIVIGENDKKDNGLWPGRDGMEKTAQSIADGLRYYKVRGSMPPPGIKDVRQMLVDNHEAIYVTKTKTLAGVGSELRAHLLANLEVFNPIGNPAEERAMAAAAADNPLAVDLAGTGGAPARTPTYAPATHASAAAATAAALAGIIAEAAAYLASTGYSAAKSNPPPDPYPMAATIKTTCPNQRVICLYKGEVENETAIAQMLVPCKRWECSVCCRVKKRMKFEMADKHITKNDQNGGELYEFVTHKSDWKSVKRSMQCRRKKSQPLPEGSIISSDHKSAEIPDGKGGRKSVTLTRKRPDGNYRIVGETVGDSSEFIGIKRADDSILCYSTSPPRTDTITAVKVEASYAIRRLKQEIELAQPSRGNRLLYTSHYWSLNTDNKPNGPTGWRVRRNATLQTTSVQDLFEILEGNKIDYTEKRTKNRYFNLTFLIWDNIPKDGRKERFYDDFGCGFYGAHLIDHDLLFAPESTNRRSIFDEPDGIFGDYLSFTT